MKQSNKSISTLLFLSLFSVAFATTPQKLKQAHPLDFAYGINWIVSDSLRESALIKIPLTDLSQKLSENFLNTPKRVFDSEGKELAFRIKKADIKSQFKTTWKPEYFIKQEKATSKSVRIKLLNTQLFIDMAQNQKLQSSQIIQKSSITASSNMGSANEWIVDLRENPSKALKLVWKNPQSVLSRIEVASSLDLIHWTKHSSNQSLSSINQNGFKLFNNTLNIPSLKRFFRIRMVHQKARPLIMEIQSQSSSKAFLQKSHKQKASFSKVSSDTLFVKTLGMPQIQSWKFELKKNEWVRYSLEYSVGTNQNGIQNWQKLKEGTLYHFSPKGIDLIKDSIELSEPKRALYWRWILESKSNQNKPNVFFFWQSDSLEVALENSSEITLAFGRNSKLELLAKKKWPSLPFEANLMKNLGEFKELSGESILLESERFPLKNWYWLGLLVFILFLANLSYKVWRESLKR